MGESFLITLREGFEAGLTVAVVFAFLRRTERMDLAKVVWAGIAASLAVSVIGGVILHQLLGGLDGAARSRTFAVACIAASGLLLWMVFWMRKQARHIKTDVERKLAEAVATGSMVGLAMVSFFAIVRDGLETALFLIASTESDLGWGAFVGGVAGVAVSVALTYGVYAGSRRIPIRRFFQISAVIMILFAGGLLSRGVMFLQLSGDLGSFNLNGVYDLTRYAWLTTSTESGRFLAALLGWDPRPSIEQVVAYLGFVIPATVMFFWQSKPAAPVPVEDAVKPEAAAAPAESRQPLPAG